VVTKILVDWKMQVGVTPEGVEVPRSLVDEKLQETIRMMPEEFQPSMPRGPDPKWRYMWRVGPRPENTRFKVIFPLSKFILCTFIWMRKSVLMSHSYRN